LARRQKELGEKFKQMFLVCAKTRAGDDGVFETCEISRVIANLTYSDVRARPSTKGLSTAVGKPAPFVCLAR